MRKKEKFKILIGVSSAIVLIFVLLGALVLAVYKYDSNSRLIRFMEKIIPLPALYVSQAGFVPVGEIKEDFAAVKKFYESQDFEQIGMRIDFNTDQGKQRLKVKERGIVNKLIENKIIENLAKKRGISISESDTDAEIERNIAQFGNKERLMSDLARLYGWTLKDFQNKVVTPELYAEKLAEVYTGEIDTAAAENKIKTLYDKVTASREDFVKVARENSEGESAKAGGDLGWSSRNQLIGEIAEKAYSLKVGETSGIIESPLGYHIIKLEEKKTENGEDLVHIRQIFVKKTTFGDWLKEQMKNYKVIVFLGDYQWNPENAEVDFRNADLRRFEENLDINSQGDPSVFP
jgi:parvulin-like peptidyl-prolyl isomerase